MKTKEHKIELDFIKKLEEIKYIYRQDIKTRNSLEQNFLSKNIFKVYLKFRGIWLKY